MLALSGETMGTNWSVRLAAPPATDAAAVAAAVQGELDAVTALFSHWDRRSELSRFNAAPAGAWRVSEPFWTVLDEIMDLAADTRGGCDPTLGALVDLWGFGPPGPRPSDAPLPDNAEIAAALAHAGRLKLRTDPVHRALVQSGGTRLDLSATAKGHAVDRVSERLAHDGFAAHLVEIGGELKGRGVKPDGQPWWVEIERPPPASPEADAPPTLVALCDLAVATSGDYRRAFVHDGETYAHTLDPETGRPVRHGVVSVTVLHARALYADAYATGMMVMGPHDGPEFAEALELAALVVERTPQGLIERASSAWRAMAEDTAP